MKKYFFVLLFLVIAFLSRAQEPFWWHAYAFNADRIDTLDIDRLEATMDSRQKDEGWLMDRADQLHYYYYKDQILTAEKFTNQVLRLLVNGEVSTNRVAHWYYGFLNLLVEKRTNLLDYRWPVIPNQYLAMVTMPDDCLPCMAIEITRFRTITKSVGRPTDEMLEQLADLFFKAQDLGYTEPLGEMAGYLAHMRTGIVAREIADKRIANIDYAAMIDTLPPRPKTYLLIAQVTLPFERSITDQIAYWQELQAIGSSSNLLALFRGNVELGILYLSKEQYDFAEQHLKLALHWSQVAKDYEAESHTLTFLEELYAKKGESFPVDLQERYDKLVLLHKQGLSNLGEAIQQQFLLDLDLANQRLERQNNRVSLLLMGLLVFLAGFSVLLYRLLMQRKKLAQLNTDKDTLYSIIAHDLRAPLSAFKGVLNKPLPPAEKEVQLDTIVHKLQWLLDDLLKWTYSQRQGLLPNIVSIDLVELIEENSHYFNDLMAQRHIKVKVELPEEVVVAGDKEMMNTIIRNLLQNAVKHNTDGGEITINLTPDRQAVILRVANTIKYEQAIEQPSLGRKLIHDFCKTNGIHWQEKVTAYSFVTTLRFNAVDL